MLEIFFNIFNAVVIGFVLYVLYMRYAYPRLTQDMALEQAQLVNLTTRYEQANKQDRHLTRSAQNQLSVFDDLTKKVEAWKRVIAQEEQLLAAQREAIRSVRRGNAEERMLIAMQREMCRKIMPRALELAHEKLIRTYQNDDAVRQYQKDVVRELSELSMRGGSHER